MFVLNRFLLTFAGLALVSGVALADTFENASKARSEWSESESGRMSYAHKDESPFQRKTTSCNEAGESGAGEVPGEHIATAVPEPQSLPMYFMGALLIGGIALRRRQRS